jgi:hypothetical protein
MKWPDCEANQSPPSNAEVKNAWSYTSTSVIYLQSLALRHRDTLLTTAYGKWGVTNGGPCTCLHVNSFLRRVLKQFPPSWSFLPPCIPLVGSSTCNSTESPSFRAEVKNAWSCTSTPPYIFMSSCLVKLRGQLTKTSDEWRCLSAYVHTRSTYPFPKTSFMPFLRAHKMNASYGSLISARLFILR